ncbi:hypothetical protein [uncultured Imperialibacter sp.]|uniref:hypothetical protein n=1 Tax=uncultured Imperialibacter sp. TaxID=1672639 RepID=UPI0030DB6CCE
MAASRATAKFSFCLPGYPGAATRTVITTSDCLASSSSNCAKTTPSFLWRSRDGNWHYEKDLYRSDH